MLEHFKYVVSLPISGLDKFYDSYFLNEETDLGRMGLFQSYTTSQCQSKDLNLSLNSVWSRVPTTYLVFISCEVTQ